MSGNIATLAADLNAICEARPFTTSWYVRDLTNGCSAHRQGNSPTPSASTRKIAIMMAVLRAVHEGRLGLAQTVVAESRMMRGVVSGVFYHMTPGLSFPLRDAILQMIITSDNICTGIIGELISTDEINALCQKMGMIGTTIRHIVPPRDMPEDADFDFVASTTPCDQGLLLERILAGTADDAAAASMGVTQELCRLALQFLGWQVYRSGIAGLLPGGTHVASKTGSGRNGKMEAGVVYRAGNPLYVLAAYTHKVPPILPGGIPGHAAATATIAELSRACWRALGPLQSTDCPKW